MKRKKPAAYSLPSSTPPAAIESNKKTGSEARKSNAVACAGGAEAGKVVSDTVGTLGSRSAVVTIWSRRPVESSFDEIARNNRVKMLRHFSPSLSPSFSGVFLCVLRLLTLSRFAAPPPRCWLCERPKGVDCCYQLHAPCTRGSRAGSDESQKHLAQTLSSTSTAHAQRPLSLSQLGSALLEFRFEVLCNEQKIRKLYSLQAEDRIHSLSS